LDDGLISSTANAWSTDNFSQEYQTLASTDLPAEKWLLHKKKMQTRVDLA